MTPTLTPQQVQRRPPSCCRRSLFTGLLGAAGAAALVGCSGERVAYPQYQLPTYAYRSTSVREGYTFAIASAENRAALEAVPCYCSCVDLGHKSLRSCFIKDNGEWDTHAAGCQTCIDETLDVKRLLGAGTSLIEIRRTIDAKYTGIGKPTNTALPAV